MLHIFLQYTRLSQFFTMIWSIIMALYMLITSALIANLYTRYCDRQEDRGSECDDDVDAKFTVFPVFGFFILVVWVSDIAIGQICDLHTKLNFYCIYTCMSSLHIQSAWHEGQ